MNLARIVRQGIAWVVARAGVRNERGASAVEYALMITLIAAVIILAVYFLGKQTSEVFSCTATSIADKGTTKC